MEQNTLEIDFQKYSKLIFGQGAKANSLFNKVSFETAGYLGKMNLHRPYNFLQILTQNGSQT